MCPMSLFERQSDAAGGVMQWTKADVRGEGATWLILLVELQADT